MRLASLDLFDPLHVPRYFCTYLVNDGVWLRSGESLIWIIVKQGHVVLAVGAGRDILKFQFSSFAYHFSFLSSSLWKTTRNRVKY